MRHRRGGFTLLELVVVIFIVGIIVTFATLSIGGRGISDKVELEAERLEQLTRLAGEQAIIFGEDFGLAVAQSEYAFLVLTDTGWRTPDQTVLRQRSLPEPMRAALALTGDDDNRFALPAPPSDEQSGDDEDEESRIEPDVLFLSTGEVTPFEITVFVPDTPVAYRIKGDITGQITMQRVDRDA